MNVETRELKLKDVDQIKYIDDNGEFEILPFIFDMLEDSEKDGTTQNYAYGIFLNEKLIGYCTIGGADEIDTAQDDDELLGDVMILDEYQGNGYGTRMVEYVLRKHSDNTIYADLMNDELIHFYKRIGFRNAYDEDFGLIKLERNRKHEN